MEQAKAISDALESLTEAHATDDSFWQGLDTLNDLTGSVSPILGLTANQGNGMLCEHWTFRSLLASMAMMIHRDVIRGKRVCVCSRCGAPFTSSSPRAAYCSLTCRNTAQKRRQREREKSHRRERL